MAWKNLLCSHAGPASGEESRVCYHPKLTGLKIVAPQQCEVCYYRQHPQSGVNGNSPALPGWDCAFLQPTMREDGESPAVNCAVGSVESSGWDAVHRCLHPAHGETTRRQCGECSDYLFPFLSPRLPVESALRFLRSNGQQRPDRWWTWPNIQAAYRRWAEDVIDGIPSYPSGYNGRGIVIVGGGKYFACAYVTIRVLRHVGCNLPIELWHLDGEMPDRERTLIQSWGCESVNGQTHLAAQGFPWHPSWWKGWQLKPFAILHSSFREVLFLDADCYPTRDPSFLFEERCYRDRGAVFWPDLKESSCLLPDDHPEVFGVEKLEGGAESGQLLVNKELCWRELNLALFYNARADYTYRHLWGDKDTFPLAWRRLGREHARLWPTAAHTPQAVLQYDGQGQVLFQHRASDKFRLPGTQFDSNRQGRTTNLRNPALAHEDFCFEVLEELVAVNDAKDILSEDLLATLHSGRRVGEPSWQTRDQLEADCRRHVAVVEVAAHRAVCRVLAGPLLLVDRREEHVARHLMHDGFWEAWITGFLSRWLRPGMFCIDVGANFGYYTALLAERSGSEGRIFAVEPQPSLAACLRESIRLNGWNHVSVIEAVLGNGEGGRTLWMGEKNSANATLRRDLSPVGFFPIARQCITLDLLAKDWPRFDFIKIDAEGAEREIWEGALGALTMHRPAVLLEFRVDRYEDPERFLSSIRELYARIHSITFDGGLRLVSDEDILQVVNSDWMLFMEPGTSSSPP